MTSNYPPTITEFLRNVKAFGDKWRKDDFIDPTLKPNTLPDPIDYPNYLPNIPTPGGL